jgi:MoaA/NifB/PqqE/SkfB family radical SAM enzyme
LINLSKLLFPGAAGFHGDALRFPEKSADVPPPVIVWHVTDECNLRCRHCYSGRRPGSGPDSKPAMEGAEAFRFLEYLRDNAPSALIMSGGEPMMHPMFFEFADFASRCGLSVALSTNGSMIDDHSSASIFEAGISYVGVSIDGPRDVHDRFRGTRGAFDYSVMGIKRMAARGCRTGLRVTLAKPLLPYLNEIMDAAERLPVSRICFYHFIPSGRGASDPDLIPDTAEERASVTQIIEWAERVGSERTGERRLEVLTVGDASDGVLLFKYLSNRGSDRAEAARTLISRSASRGIGEGILSVRWDGLVFPNQFDWETSLGRWTDLDEIRRRKRQNCGRGSLCVGCEWTSMCGGSLRAGLMGRCSLTE